ncbi:MAG: sulfotransferase, partial [Candidatus Hodarchaeota archaeon]
NYVTRLYNPTGHFPMNLYSDNSEELNIEKNASFVAYLKYFIQEARNKSDLLSALPCAVFITNGQFQKGHKPKIWVEKTPTNEYYIELAKNLFPNSKFIYITRNPYDNLASIRRWYINSGREEISNVYRYFSQLKESITKAIKMRTRDDFYLIKYEDLVFNPENEMRNVSKFLDIQYDDCLTTPTIMGIPNRANISDVKDENRNVSGAILKSPVHKYKKSLIKREINDITIEFSGLMNIIGYKHEKISILYKLFRYPLSKAKNKISLSLHKISKIVRRS